MNYTTNFNLNKPEGTDLYNHLTVDNPNMDTIDAAMQVNKLASVGAATELVSGTLHAITRADSNQNIFKFKATGDFKAGDSVTVDGVSVNAFTTDGQQLLDDAYVLSAEVLCILDGTSLWILANGVKNITDDIASINGDITTMQGDITDLQDVTKWKPLQSVNLTSAQNIGVNIPAGAEEIYINAQGIGVNLIVPVTALDATPRYFNNGYYMGSSNYASLACEMTKTTIGYTTDTRNGAFASTFLLIYYR